jgi:lysophospholipase L1-like esterase
MTRNAQHRLFLFGDSICFGQDVALHKTWAARLSAALDAALAPSGVEVALFNPSVNGNTTRQALERLSFDVLTRRPDTALVQFGMNDANCWDSDRGLPRVGADAFVANLVEIVDRLAAAGAGVVLLDTNHPTTRTAHAMAGGETYEAANRRYNDLIRRAASSRPNVVLNDIEAHIRGRDAAEPGFSASLVLDDGLHLSERGHDVYFEFLAPRLADAVRKSEARKTARP